MVTRTKLYVGNLSWGVTDDDLQAFFSPFGPVLDVNVMKDPQTGRSRGFGFVTFGSSKEAENAIADTNERVLDGRVLMVHLATVQDGVGGMKA